MTLGTLLFNIGIVAIVLTGIMVFLIKNHKNILTSFLQNFCGALFIFSGWVKAVDPLGTAYKMEQYFDEFYTTFTDTWFSFIAPLFPVFADYSIWFSLFMIIFEIVLGVMLIIGAKPKFTAWAFFLLVAFFTVLTGFTFLTGYVPPDANFFELGSWAAYDKNNMKVTDCGCFGDFIKLEPKISFFKDIFLLFPSVYFLFAWDSMHQLFSKKVRSIITAVSTGILIAYCLNNYMYDLPKMDFRPFKKDADIRATREAEEDAAANVKILSWKLKNKTDYKIVEVPHDVYMKTFTKDYPKSDWEIIEQLKTEPSIESTKISEMEFEDINESYDVTFDILDDTNASLMVVCYKLKADVDVVKSIVQDTSYQVDTIFIEGFEDSLQLVKRIDKINPKEVSSYVYNWDPTYLKNFKEKILPLSNKAINDGVAVRIMIGGADTDMIKALEKEVGFNGVQFCKADDILLKTIVRSNPGVVLWKDGKILDKWHIKRLPDYNVIKNKF